MANAKTYSAVDAATAMNTTAQLINSALPFLVIKKKKKKIKLPKQLSKEELSQRVFIPSETEESVAKPKMNKWLKAILIAFGFITIGGVTYYLVKKVRASKGVPVKENPKIEMKKNDDTEDKEDGNKKELEVKDKSHEITLNINNLNGSDPKVLTEKREERKEEKPERKGLFLNRKVFDEDDDLWDDEDEKEEQE